MSSKKCKVCGASVPENSKFCPDCGATLNGKQVTQKGSKTKSTGMRDNIIIIGVIIVVAVVFIIIKSPSESEHQHVQQQQMNQMQGSGSIENPHGEGGLMNNLPNMPKDHDGLVQMGNSTMDQGNYAMAAECYKRALQIKDDPDVRTDFGACLHGMGLPERALEEFRKVLAHDSDHGIVNFNMGIIYFGMDNKDSAKFYWEKYIKVDPNGLAVEQAKEYLKGL
ncbi:MAG: zinc-ribbon domain-containing protein [candidate division Zixibacteria bacterium]|nr:zinc-ribbon domain-containing protein [candidate division Zixibacteria bacterium]